MNIPVAIFVMVTLTLEVVKDNLSIQKLKNLNLWLKCTEPTHPPFNAPDLPTRSPVGVGDTRNFFFDTIPSTFFMVLISINIDTEYLYIPQ